MSTILYFEIDLNTETKHHFVAIITVKYKPYLKAKTATRITARIGVAAVPITTARGGCACCCWQCRGRELGSHQQRLQ